MKIDIFVRSALFAILSKEKTEQMLSDYNNGFCLLILKKCESLSCLYTLYSISLSVPMLGSNHETKHVQQCYFACVMELARLFVILVIQFYTSLFSII